jgi:hypothetical protein
LLPVFSSERANTERSAHSASISCSIATKENGPESGVSAGSAIVDLGTADGARFYASRESASTGGGSRMSRVPANPAGAGSRVMVQAGRAGYYAPAARAPARAGLDDRHELQPARNPSFRRQPMQRFVRPRSTLFAATLLTLLAGCAGLRPGYETPTVTVNAFRVIPSQGALPDFEIGLQVINPNREALSIVGISYTVSLDGYEVIKGVGKDLPTIEAYDQANFTVTAAANVFAGIRLFNDLLSKSDDRFRYEFAAKLDVGAFRPAIRVTDAGEISLTP